MELGPEDVSLLERCPHFRGCYVQASMELGPEDVSLLERFGPYSIPCLNTGAAKSTSVQKTVREVICYWRVGWPYCS